MMSNRPKPDRNHQARNHQMNDTRLSELFLAYRDACPDPEPGVNFMPQMWAKIEARENSTNWFGRIAKTLVTAALATSVVLALLISFSSQPGASFLNGSFVEAVALENASTLEPFHLDRIAAAELDRQ